MAYTNPPDFQIVRDLLSRAGLSTAAAARELQVDETRVAAWCERDAVVPRWPILALERLVAHGADDSIGLTEAARSSYRRNIASNVAAAAQATRAKRNQAHGVTDDRAAPEGS